MRADTRSGSGSNRLNESCNSFQGISVDQESFQDSSATKPNYSYNTTSSIAIEPVMGSISHDNMFDTVGIEKATEMAGQEKYKGLTLHAATLALICVESWEAEYNAMQHAVNRALTSATRRMAIGGKFVANNAAAAGEERRALLRILKWCVDLSASAIYP